MAFEGEPVVSVRDVSERSIAELTSLARRVAVVTGGAQGIGLAIARRLAEAGADIALADIDDVALGAAVAQLQSSYDRKVIGLHVDVADEDAVRHFADDTVAEFGGLHIWVNNAGIYPAVPFLELTTAQWRAVIDVNLNGAYFGAREAAARMVAAGDPGVIVNVASVAAYRANPTCGAEYISAKHAVRGLTKSLAAQLGGHGIRVLAVAPTTIETPGLQRSREEIAGAGFDAIDAHQVRPLGRDGVPDDIARVVLFCACDLSILMTGSTVLVDGGTLALL
ncbi:SDR family NAD(P)-dependent oxidoreductase [Jiangella asiatica]|uniref:SDR family oxidoreductase n=1 Tax=Jiangella asiatica TaxID=2530372 RepID=A0A4V2YYU0_9ACTN|nr:SDR family NAD(P)-dependent oxidoreductase [Jiangella asiatica]TDD94387.1 SDR family oxidoreductase [Jiangella asiatica]